MKKIYLEVVKVCAVGCDKNFITCKYLGKEFTFFTSNRGLYIILKENGVPTSQKLSKRKVI